MATIRTGENTGNSETEEETLALRKKRSRRVSFADREITSVHIFNRDEDYETPPESTGNRNAENVPESDEVLCFLGDFDDIDDSKQHSPFGPPINDDDVDEHISARKSFFRPIESPSPGSSFMGSATSVDDVDNFFGPVSASFIRPGRLSDSAASDDNHEVTMDSTAFSMHYRSLAGSESGGAGERTPSNVGTPSDPGSFMVLTEAKKLVSDSTVTVDRVISGGRDSNDMSLVGEKPRTYDYGKLSPDLEVLLAEGRMSVPDGYVSEPTYMKSRKGCDISLFDANDSVHMDQIDGGRDEVSTVDRVNMSAKKVSVVSMESDKMNVVSVTTVLGQNTHESSSIGTNNLAVSGSTDYGMQSPSIQLSKLQFPNSLTKVNSEYGKAMMERNSLHDVSCGILVDIDDSLPQHDSEKHSVESLLKQTLCENRRHGDGIDQNCEQQHESLITGFASFLPAKQQQIYLDSANSCRKSSFMTPSPKASLSFLGKVDMTSCEVVSSTRKSNNMINIFEPSPFASALKDGIDRSKLRLSKLLSSAISPVNIAVEDNRKDVEGKLVHVPIVKLEQHLFDDDPKKIHIEKMQLQMIEPEKSTEVTLHTPGSGSTLMEIEGGHRTGLLTTSEPNNFLSSRLMRSDQKLQSSIECLRYRSDELKQQIFGSEQDASMIGDVTNKTLLPALTDNLQSRGTESDVVQSHTYLPEIKCFEHTPPMKILNGRPSYLADKQHVSETVGSIQSSLRETNVLNLYPGSPDRNTSSETYLIHPEVGLPEERNKISCTSASPKGCKSINGSPHKDPSTIELARTPKKVLTFGPSEKDAHHLSSVNHFQPVVQKDVPSPHSNSNRLANKDIILQHQLHTPLSPSPTHGTNNSSRRKRRIGDQDLQCAGSADKITRGRRSPKASKCQESNSDSVLMCINGNENGRQMVGMTQWRDLSLKFSEDSKQLTFPSMDKLNIREIDEMQYILLNWKKVKIFELFRSHIQSQNTTDSSAKVRMQRLYETRSLLCKLMYEKARMQLMSVKREKLQKRAQQLSSVIQKTEMFKSNFSRHPSLPGERATQLGDNMLSSCVLSPGSKLEVFSEKVAKMRHEDEALKMKIKSLTKSFHMYCKMKDVRSCSETIVLLNDHIKKRTRCQLIREDLQLWEVEDFCRNGSQSSILLNYQGFIGQRFTVNSSPTQSTYVSNQINSANILKQFPNMDACTAFAFVLNSWTPRRYIASRTLAQETQMITTLLSNLLDVVEEVQRARIEIKNLVHTSFHSSSVKQLDLQLCFVEFNSFGKVILTLDLTCLKRGIYPSESLPCDVQTSFAGSRKSYLGLLSAEINNAVGGLSGGHSRIIRLCRCVSQVVQLLHAQSQEHMRIEGMNREACCGNERAEEF